MFKKDPKLLGKEKKHKSSYSKSDQESVKNGILPPVVASRGCLCPSIVQGACNIFGRPGSWLGCQHQCHR